MDRSETEVLVIKELFDFLDYYNLSEIYENKCKEKSQVLREDPAEFLIVSPISWGDEEIDWGVVQQNWLDHLSGLGVPRFYKVMRVPNGFLSELNMGL